MATINDKPQPRIVLVFLIVLLFLWMLFPHSTTEPDRPLETVVHQLRR
jgi:hypothetical protein